MVVIMVLNNIVDFYSILMNLDLWVYILVCTYTDLSKLTHTLRLTNTGSFDNLLNGTMVGKIELLHLTL
jgi:hypothetical protein